MKKLLFFLLPVVAFGQAVNVTVNPSGQLRAPANFWTANASDIATAAASAFTSGSISAGSISGLAAIATTGEWADLQSIPAQFPGGITGTAFGIYDHSSGDSSVIDYSSARSAGSKWFVDDAGEFRTAIGLANAALTTEANTFADDQTAPAWLLAGTGATDTITPSQVGIGWADGRLTIQSAAGAMQVYQTGSPLVSVWYWPGRLTVGAIEASTINGALSGQNVTGSLASGVLSASYTMPFDRLQSGASFAGANGITYVTDTDYLGETEPTVGVYWMQVNVAAGGTTAYNEMRGRYRTQAQALTDLGRITATATLDFPSIAAGAQADLTITLTGAATGDSVFLGLPAAPAAGLVFNAFVSAANTVTIRASNITASPVDAASVDYRVTKF